MKQYLGLLFQGIWGKDYWAARWSSFLALIRNPGDFYGSVGKKDWDQDAYLLGLSLGLLQVVLFAFVFSGLIGLLTGKGGLLVLVLSLGFGLLGWFLGMFLLYHVVARIFGFALKLITRKNETAKIRPILFTLCPAGLLGIIPGVGGLLTLAGFVVLLVIAYEKALKVERGQAVGSSLLGLVFTGLAAWIPALVVGLVLTTLFTGGFATLALMMHLGGRPDLQASAPKTTLADSWGAFEFLHHRSPEQKLADAVDVIHDEILGSLASDLDAQENAFPLLVALYGDPAQVPMDAYRLAVQKTLEQDKDVQAKYFSTGSEVYFDQIIDSYYDKGKGPAAVTVAAVEDRRRAWAQMNQLNASLSSSVQTSEGVGVKASAFKKMRSNVQKKTVSETAQTETEAAIPVAQVPVPTPTPSGSDPLLGAAKQVGTDAAVDGARKLLGF